MQARSRRLAAALGAATALVGLTACERPTPLVTIQSGDRSINDRAFSFCFEGQDPQREPGTEGACRFDTGDDRTPKVLEVRPGDEVLVDVDRDLIEAGWLVVLRTGDGRQSRLATQQDEHVTSFQPDFNEAGTITLEVQKLDRPADDATVLGVWQFALVPG